VDETDSVLGVVEFVGVVDVVLGVVEFVAVVDVSSRGRQSYR